jgi:hypothetical protein
MASAAFVSPSIDLALRGLAAFWSRNPRRLDAALFHYSHSNASFLSSSSSSERTGGLHVLNDSPMAYEPLYVIIGFGISLLAGDIAFGKTLGRAWVLKKRPGSETSLIGTAAVPLTKEVTAVDIGISPSSSTMPPPLPSAASRSGPVSLEEEKELAEEWEHFKRTKLRFLILSMCLAFFSELLLWMLAPFFPMEGLRRGLSTEVVGVIFACHPIALGVSSQLAPWLMRSVEPFLLLQRTLLLQAVFVASFGLSGNIEPGLPFACCAITNRLLIGSLSGINEPCSQAIAYRNVPRHKIAHAFGLIIAAQTSAIVIGPALGGALYEAGGFPLPFLVAAALFLLLGMATMYVGATTQVTTTPAPTTISVWRLLRVRGMALMLSCMLLLWFDVMFLEPCYEPVLAAAPYSLPPTIIGLVLSAATLSMVVVMTLSSALGHWMDPCTQHTAGFVVLAAALPFLGPSPHLRR